MNCPKCKNEKLNKQNLKNLEIDVCDKCGGIWFDKDELRKVKDIANEDLEWMDFDIWKDTTKHDISKSEISCPKCMKEMAAVNYDNTNVIVDYCGSCEGFWLDQGEFEQIITKLDDRINTMTSSEYIKASFEEAKEIINGKDGFISEWKDFLKVIHLLEYRLLIENPKVQKYIQTAQERNPAI